MGKRASAGTERSSGEGAQVDGWEVGKAGDGNEDNVAVTSAESVSG